METPAPPTEPPAPTGEVNRDAHCVGCSYNLRGLDAASRCPECGTLIERSLRGDLLEYSAPAYLESLRRGIMIIIVAMIAESVTTVLAMSMAIVFAIRGAALANFDSDVAVALLDLVFSIIAACGWWLFSSPDPAIRTENTGSTARKIVRSAAIVSACAVVVAFLPYGLAISTSGAPFDGGVSTLVSLIAGVVVYFASLLYVRWLARRIPDRKMYDDATRLLWLGPLIYILGSCLLIGPLVAIILYLLLLNRMRVSIRDIMQAQPPTMIEA